MNLTDIRAALELGRVELDDPLSESRLAAFERHFGVAMCPSIRGMYLTFNGFLSCHHKSQITLWPLERVSEHGDLITGGGCERYFLIGDLLIDSDFLMCCLSNENAPILLQYERRQPAPGLAAFIERLIAGEFDFCRVCSEWTSDTLAKAADTPVETGGPCMVMGGNPINVTVD
jgi:hypothetical protein